MTIERDRHGNLTRNGEPVTPPEPATLGDLSTGQAYGVGYQDGATFALFVRELMDAAGHEYDPARPIAEQVRECGHVIRDDRRRIGILQVGLDQTIEQNNAEIRRLTDLVDELRKQLAGAVAGYDTLKGDFGRVREERDGLRKIVMDKDQELETADTDARRDAADKIRAVAAHAGLQPIVVDELAAYVACPCRPGAPTHEHGQGGYQLDSPTPQDGAG